MVEKYSCADRGCERGGATKKLVLVLLEQGCCVRAMWGAMMKSCVCGCDCGDVVVDGGGLQKNARAMKQKKRK